MTNDHLSEMEIQQYASNKPGADPEIVMHVQGCEACSARVAAYALLFSAIKDMPKQAFDFDLAGLVLSKIPRSAPSSSRAMPSAYLLAAVIIFALAVPVYLYWHHIANLFAGILPMVMYLIITTALTLLVFQGILLYKKYENKMNILNTV
ncbi:MAG TPA: hypothetical protein VK543_01485 [Puia sp.]|nr:hypothetical protein [Puia sp.]